jgi:uncharacterized protein with PIN domain
MSPDEKKPSIHEEKYFADENQRLTEQLRARLDKERAERERTEHYMRCPKCGGDLTEIEYEMVHIDRCTSCGGVWLDAGELQMLERRQAAGAKGFLSAMFGR